LLAQIPLHVMCLHACANLHLPPVRPAGGNQERVRPGGEQASSCFQCWPLSAGELGSHPLVSADSAACNVPPCMCQLAPASGKASRRESGKSAARRRTGIQLPDLPAPLWPDPSISWLPHCWSLRCSLLACYCPCMMDDSSMDPCLLHASCLHDLLADGARIHTSSRSCPCISLNSACSACGVGSLEAAYSAKLTKTLPQSRRVNVRGSHRRRSPLLLPMQLSSASGGCARLPCAL